jgi:hypothetical protein
MTLACWILLQSGTRREEKKRGGECARRRKDKREGNEKREGDYMCTIMRKGGEER